MTTENNLTSFSQIEIQDQKKKKRKFGPPKLVVNIHYTQYPIVKTAAKESGFRCKTDDINILALAGIDAQPGSPPIEDFDVCWIDCGIPPEALAKLKPYQRISQFPGIQVISNKSKLARNLMKMRKCYPEEYDFFPQTYLLPVEYNEFKNQMRNRREIFIVKPEALCQGKGIYLIKDPSEVSPDEHIVAQRYLADPFLLDGLKFDLRIYVLLFGVRPLRILIYKEGLVRLATEKYTQPTDQNMKNHFMHLTNYAINKNSDKFIENDDEERDQDEAHKRSLTSLYARLEDEGYHVQGLKDEINDIVIKTIIVGQPSLAHIYKTCQADDIENQACFQILGFDIMIDSQLKPWLLEVNQSPSFKTDANLDTRVKGQLIRDTLNLLNLSQKRKMRYITKARNELKQRMLTGKKIHLTGQEREIQILKKQDVRDKFELQNLGDYELIFPPKNAILLQEYKILQDQASLNWEELTTGRRRQPPTKFTVSNEKNDPRGTIYHVSKRQSVAPPETKQKIIKLGKLHQEKPVIYKNTFANEMRSLAQSQLIKQLETKKVYPLVQLDQSQVEKTTNITSQIPLILGQDTHQASNFMSPQKQLLDIKQMSTTMKPPRLPLKLSQTKTTQMQQLLTEQQTPNGNRSNMMIFQIEPPIQPQLPQFHNFGSPNKSLKQKLQYQSQKKSSATTVLPQLNQPSNEVSKLSSALQISGNSHELSQKQQKHQS